MFKIMSIAGKKNSHYFNKNKNLLTRKKSKDKTDTTEQNLESNWIRLLTSLSDTEKSNLSCSLNRAYLTTSVTKQLFGAKLSYVKSYVKKMWS